MTDIRKFMNIAQASTINEDEHGAWANSRWTPKEVGSDISIEKATYDVLFADAFKQFPDFLKHWFRERGYGVGGNGIFDVLGYDFIVLFEDEVIQDDFSTPDQAYQQLVNLAAFAKKLELAVDNLSKRFGIFDTKINNITDANQALELWTKVFKDIVITLDNREIKFSTVDKRGVFQPYPSSVWVDGSWQSNKVIYSNAVGPLLDMIWNQVFNNFDELELLVDGVDYNKAKIKTQTCAIMPTLDQMTDWYDL